MSQAHASAPEPSSTEEPEGEAEQAQFEWQPGPAEIALGHKLGLSLPADYAFLDAPQAAKVLELNGNFHNENVLGLVTGKDDEPGWFAVIEYVPAGFIKDDETIDADAILSAIREGTEQGNEERKARGFDALEIEGWFEAPHYEAEHHRLVWAMVARGPHGKSANYSTRVLGRHGYASLTLVADPSELPQVKPHAELLLAGEHFETGARYEDFDAKTDKVAEYGLAGLVLAGAGLGAAKLVKLGLIAKFWSVIVAALIAGKKVVVLAVLALAAAAKRFFGRRQTNA
jgi:uncharacterized membrane-anchored protein